MEDKTDNQKQLRHEISESVLARNSKEININLKPSSLFFEGHDSYLTPILTANNIANDCQYNLSIYPFIEVSHTLIKSGNPRSSNLRGEAIRSLSNRNNGSNTKNWFILLAEAESKQSNYDISAYKDLIELASILDMTKPAEA